MFLEICGYKNSRFSENVYRRLSASNTGEVGFLDVDVVVFARVILNVSTLQMVPPWTCIAPYPDIVSIFLVIRSFIACVTITGVIIRVGVRNSGTWWIFLSSLVLSVRFFTNTTMLFQYFYHRLVKDVRRCYTGTS